MMNELEKMMEKAIKMEKDLLDKHEDELKELQRKSANIEKEGIEIKAKALKDGLTNNNTLYCKYCGTSIDDDSIYCKKCGKKINEE